jgi:hypothetical protein
MFYVLKLKLKDFTNTKIEMLNNAYFDARGGKSKLHFPLPSMNRITSKDLATFSILLFIASLSFTVLYLRSLKEF